MTYPPKKVYTYFDLWIIARTKDEAIEILLDELGTTRRAVVGHISRATGPFKVMDSLGIETEVDEVTFCRSVGTYGGGIVKEY